MDTGVLVETKIDDGARLIRLLVREQFGVEVAFWAKTSEESLWQLWIASPAVNPMDPGKAIRIVYEALVKCPAVSPSEITLRANTDPIARAAVALRDRYPSREPRRYRGQRLGTLTAEELLIYPLPLPWEVRELPDGSWQVLISERDDVWLTCESEDEARAIAVAPVLQYEALGQLNTGEQFAAELDKTADTMEKYRMGFGSRFLRRRANEVRQQIATSNP